MVISFKDSLKLIGIIIVTFCAVFVCTFFLNFYLDAKSLEDMFLNTEAEPLYKAQMATAKFTTALSGGFLGLIAVIMLVFYIKLYIDNHAVQIGIIKAMGYSNAKIAVRLSIFGISVLMGALLGFGCAYIFMPVIYDSLSIDGLKITINFHAILVLLVVAPTLIFSALACGYAYIALHRPVSELLHGKSEKIKIKSKKSEKERSFLKDLCINTVFGKKSLAFFVMFACFCFSAMVQMACSMQDLNDDATMGIMILIIGVVLAVTTLLMAITTLVNNNIKNISIMKAFGYSMKKCALTVLGGYHLFAFIGFAIGTLYQFGLLSLMVNIVYKDVGFIPDYNFNVPEFFITLAVFVVFYEAVMLFYTYKMSKISVKEVMAEN